MNLALKERDPMRIPEVSPIRILLTYSLLSAIRIIQSIDRSIFRFIACQHSIFMILRTFFNLYIFSEYKSELQIMMAPANVSVIRRKIIMTKNQPMIFKMMNNKLPVDKRDKRYAE
jgi:hypothetical protein